jgi:hypothetical protein
MIAAMFPVTIRQTQSTMGDTHGANTAKAALAYLQSIATDKSFPVTSNKTGDLAPVFSLQETRISGPPAPFDRPAYLEARGNFIDPNNPRIAWVPLYRRGTASDGTPEPYAQVTIIVLQSRNRPQYTSLPQPTSVGNTTWNDIASTTTLGFPTATLEPARVQVQLRYDAGEDRGRMEFKFSAGAATARPAPGSYVVIANDTTGRANGRIYQLGNPIDESKQVWALAPGSDMITVGPNTDDNLTADTDAFIVGRGYADMTQQFDPNDPAKGFAGPAQEIAVYTGFIQVTR